jgi:hypothetical protein
MVTSVHSTHIMLEDFNVDVLHFLDPKLPLDPLAQQPFCSNGDSDEDVFRFVGAAGHADLLIAQHGHAASSVGRRLEVDQHLLLVARQAQRPSLICPADDSSHSMEHGMMHVLQLLMQSPRSYQEVVMSLVQPMDSAPCAGRCTYRPCPRRPPKVMGRIQSRHGLLACCLLSFHNRTLSCDLRTARLP